MIKKLMFFEGLKSVKMYLNSLNRFGKTAFIYPLYGSSEISQAFCRVGAIYNGIYVLRRGCSDLYFNDKNIAVGIKCTEKQYIQFDNIVLNKNYEIKDKKISMNGSNLHCICITDKPLMKINEKDDLIITIFPPKAFDNEQPNTIYLCQMTHSTQCTPEGLYLINFYSTGFDNEIFKKIVNKILTMFEFFKN